MRYTQEEKKKIWENVDKIKEYIHTLQPEIRKGITVDFGKMTNYGWEWEKECHLYVYDDYIRGRIGGLPIEFEKVNSSSVASDVYFHLDYTVKLIENWQSVKAKLLEEIDSQKLTFHKINNFEV